ncbi:MAG TPA: hypothetical protein VK553_09285, partial [Candidatus Nitrosopolaris rasttigaisensis]|nr:hypothetical protein [Candidatus Nitrosopolaris rasttigaisensis]
MSVKENEGDIEEIDDIFDDNESPKKPSDTSDTPSDTLDTPTQEPATRPGLDSKFFAIRITGGQENIV